MSTHPSDQAEQAIRFASIHRPQQIKQKLLVSLRAFIFQHEALLHESAKEIRAMFECGCDECIVNCAEGLAVYGQICADLRQLSNAHDLVCDVSAHFPRPGADSMEVAAEGLRERMIQTCAGDSTDEARESLERLISNPNESHPDAQA
jgi:hypothetical protein